MFLGMFAAFVGLAIFSDSYFIENAFRFVIDTAHISRHSTIYGRNFSDFDGIFSHNCIVLMSLAILAFFYRGYGALLTLGWNACVWGLTLTILFRQSFWLEGNHNPGSLLLGAVAILPHLVLEAGAYIVGVMGAIGMSKTLLWHRWKSKRFWLGIGKNLMVAFGAAVVLLLAALMEANWAPWMIKMTH